MGCLVLIVQHGEKQRLPGGNGLTKFGRLQADATGDWLRSSHSVTRIVTSPLRRAVETCDPIARRVGLAATTDDRLGERMNWEGGDGQTLEEFLFEWRRTSLDRSFVPTNGDSSHKAASRFIEALDELARMTGDDGEVVVVAHGGVTVDALRTLLGDESLLARAAIADRRRRSVLCDHDPSTGAQRMGCRAALHCPPRGGHRSSAVLRRVP